MIEKRSHFLSQISEIKSIWNQDLSEKDQKF